MPRKGFDEFKVGLFVSAGLLLAMIIIFMIGSDNRIFHRQYTLYANFETISGLRVGAPVQLAGLKVGFVDGIRFPDNPASKNIGVVLRIERQYQKRIRSDSEATVETQGLLGDKFIYISVGSEEAPVIPDKGILPSKETTSIFSLADKAGRIMDNLGEASETVNKLLSSVKGGEGGDIRRIVTSVRKTVEQVEKGDGLMHAIIYDPKGKKLVSDLGDTMSSLKGIVSGAEEESKGQMGGMITNLKYASRDLRQIMESIRKGEGTLGKMIMDPALYDDLRTLIGRVNRNKLLKAVIRSTMKENDRQVLK
jgi:phospholipid/cholesterol/gamma-HCH transport system substrate-binding protein